MSVAGRAEAGIFTDVLQRHIHYSPPESYSNQWLPGPIRQTCDSMVVSSIPGRRTIGRLVLGWATVLGLAYHPGM